jgi:ketosteroid isomerase-like protein
MTEESTTPDLVELGRRLLDAANAGDIDAGMSFYAPKPVLDLSETFGVFEGRAAIRGFFEDWLGSYDEMKLEFEESCDLGAGVGFAAVVLRGRPRGSAGWVQARYASVRHVSRRADRAEYPLPRHRPGPRSRRTARGGTGVSGV